MPKGKGYGSMPGSQEARNKLIAAYKPRPARGPKSKQGSGAPVIQQHSKGVKRSMRWNNMIESHPHLYHEDPSLSAWKRAEMATHQKYGIRPNNSKVYTNPGDQAGIGSSRARQKLIMTLYPKGLK